MEETGLLAGLQGILPVEMLIAQPRAAPPPLGEAAPVGESPKARLFAEIVARPAAMAPKALAQPKARGMSLVPRAIIYVALLVAVAFPLLLNQPLLPRDIEPAPAVADLYAAIESLDEGAPVLVAFDYDPTTSGEMNLVAGAIVGHLMDRGARVVAVSLLPAGPATAQLLLDDLAADRPRYADGYGQTFANLGYLSGQAAAVRLVGESLATALPGEYAEGTPLADLPVMAGLDDLEDFDLVVELAAAQNSLRWWVEQVGSSARAPLAAGVSASVEPLARPYFEAEQNALVGVVGGVPGAAAYDAQRQGPGDQGPAAITAIRLDAQLGGHVVLVLVLLLGNVAYLVQRGRGGSR